MKKITGLLAIGTLALAACGSGGSSSSTPASSSSASNTTASSGGYGKPASTSKTTAVSNSGSGKTEIEMYDDYFGPKTITGKPGSTVKVELKNEGKNEHNFKIDGQKGADADVEPGEDGKAVVKIPASGTIQFYCEYHKGLGMVGTVKAS